MIAQKICDYKVTQDRNDKYTVRTSRSTHLLHTYTQNDEHRYKVHINPQNTVCSLTVTIEWAVRA